MIRAVFFDLDGVLIDSETIQHLLLKETLKEKGYRVPAEAFIGLIGSHKSLNPWDEIIKEYNLKMDSETIRREIFQSRRERFLQINKKDMMFPEVVDVLQRLRKRGTFIACASSSSPTYITETLQQCGITKLFDLVTSSDNFEKSKPASDIYDYCRHYFKLEKEECLVIEDSPIGIQAGKAAGLEVWARINPIIALDQRGADRQINSLIAIIDQLEQGEVMEDV